jgi:hypothetical protein
MQKQYERVKLHVTLMNTLFRNDESESETLRRKQKHRETFNATDILKVCICGGLEHRLVAVCLQALCCHWNGIWGIHNNFIISLIIS